jgi:large subunit ribosomal protein L15
MNEILSNLPASARTKYKRVGKGVGSGKGHKSGRGQQGMTGRSGGKPGVGYEGGQTPLYLLLPRVGMRGVKNTVTVRKRPIFVVNSRDVLRVCEKYNLNKITGDDLLKFLNAPFYKKKVKIIGDRKLLEKINFDGIIN